MNTTWSDVKRLALTSDRTTRFGGNGPIGDNIIYMDNGNTKIVIGNTGKAHVLNGGVHALYEGRAQWTLDEVYSWLLADTNDRLSN